MRLSITALLLAACVCVAGVAIADDKAEAEAIFKEGVEEMMSGDFASGCPKIAEAHRLTQGAGALFTLAECYAKWDKPATARRHYRAYLKVYAKLPAAARKWQDERAKLATTQIAALSALVPTLTIVLPDDVEATVTVDDESVPSDALNSPLPLEIGPHRIVVTAADGQTAVHEVDLTEGVQRRWEVKLSGGDKPPVDPDGPDTEPSDWTAVEITGVVLGVTGILVVGVGAVTGVLALGKRSTADEHCVELTCDAEGLDAVASGKTLGDVSTATLVAGGVTLVTGLILFLVGGNDEAETVQLTPHGVRWSF